jgi:hypothetical protein
MSARRKPRTGQPRSLMNAVTAQELLVQFSATLLLGMVALFAAWRFLF